MANDPNESTNPARQTGAGTTGPGGGPRRSATARNQGEGNREAAAEFNEAERRFVNSPAGQQKIEQGTHLDEQDEQEGERAEQAAKQRAKAQDSNHM